MQKFGKNETSLAQARLLAEITQKKDKFFSRHVWGTCDHSMWFETTVDGDAPSAPLHITLMIHSPFVPENFVELLHMFQNCLVQIWIFYELVICNTESLTAFQIDIEEIGIWQSFLLDLYSSICCICWKLVVVKTVVRFRKSFKRIRVYLNKSTNFHKIVNLKSSLCRRN